MRLPDNRPKIRCGQLWRKKDSGMVAMISGSRNHQMWAMKKVLPKAGAKSHGVYEKDLYLFWEKL